MRKVLSSMSAMSDQHSDVQTSTRLNPLETQFAIMLRDANMLTPVIYLCCNGGFDATKFDSALVALQERHTILRATLQLKPLRFKWSSSSQPVPWKFHTVEDEYEVWGIATALAVGLAASDAPLARAAAVAVSGTTRVWILLAAAHALADAACLRYLMRDLIAMYNGSGSQLPPAPPHVSTPRPPAPSFLSQWRFMELMARKLMTKSHGTAARKWRPAPDRIAACELSSPLTALLVATCKRNGTTVYGALTAALLRSPHLRDHCFEGDRASKHAQEIKITTPIDLRRHSTNVPDDAMGTHVAALLSFWPAARSSVDGLWAQAKQARDRLTQAMTRGEHTDLFHHVSMQLGALAAVGGKFRYSHRLHRSTIESNSLGRVRLDVDGSVTSSSPHHLKPKHLGWVIIDSPSAAPCGQAQIYSLTVEELGRLHIMCHVRSHDAGRPSSILREIIEELAEACGVQVKEMIEDEAEGSSVIKCFDIDRSSGAL